MTIIKKKEIFARDVSELSNEYSVFIDRKALHKNAIPPYFVYIEDLAWNAFIQHSSNVYKKVRHEAQGVFVGRYYKDQFGEFVIAFKYEEGSGLSESAYSEMDETCLAEISRRCKNEETLMLVHIHSHPGFHSTSDAWYSSTDCRNLKTHFYKQYHIGIVVDI